MAGNFFRDLGSIIGWRAPADQPPKDEKKAFKELPHNRIMILKKGSKLPFDEQTINDIDFEVRIHGENDTEYVGSHGGDFGPIIIDVHYPKEDIRPLSKEEVESKRTKNDFNGFLSLEDDGGLIQIPGLFEKIENMTQNKERVWIKRSDGSWSKGTAEGIGRGAVEVSFFDDAKGKQMYKSVNPSDLIEWQNLKGPIS